MVENSFQDDDLSAEHRGSLGNNSILEKQGELEAQVVCCGRRYWILKVAVLSEKAFSLSSHHSLDVSDETPLIDITDISPIQMAESRLISEQKIIFLYVMHTMTEDWRRHFRVDSVDDSDEWTRSVQKLSSAVKRRENWKDGRI